VCGARVPDTPNPSSFPQDTRCAPPATIMKKRQRKKKHRQQIKRRAKAQR
jgi:hypothetical protein